MQRIQVKILAIGKWQMINSANQYNSMNTVFSEEEGYCLRSKLWWVPCNQTPFLMRIDILQRVLLLQITDLKTVWVTRLTDKQVIEQKEKYAKNLAVSDSQELLNLFKQLLSRPDPSTSYLITKKKNNVLELQIDKTIQVYPLHWKFKLVGVECNNIRMICEDLLNPLIRTVSSQESAYQILWRKARIIQQELVKKMTENQKNSYKSPFSQLPNPQTATAESIEGILQQVAEQNFSDDDLLRTDILIDLNLQPYSKLIYENSCVPRRQGRARSLSSIKSKGNKAKEPKAGILNERKQRKWATEQQLVNELVLQREVDEQANKKKKVDFL